MAIPKSCTCKGPDAPQTKNWGHKHFKSCPLYKEMEGFDYPPGVDALDAYGSLLFECPKKERETIDGR